MRGLTIPSQTATRTDATVRSVGLVSPTRDQVPRNSPQLPQRGKTCQNEAWDNGASSPLADVLKVKPPEKAKKSRTKNN